MTKRDKKLLMFLGIFLIVVGFSVFIFMPKMETLGALNEQVDNANFQKEEILLKSTRLSQLEDSLKEKETELATVTGHFYPIMQTQEMDNWLTKKAMEQGLSIRLLNIGQVEESELLSAYVGCGEVQEAQAEKSEENLGNNLVELSLEEGQTTGEDLEEDAVEESEQPVHQSQISITVEGDSSNVQKLMDELFADSSVLVTGWQRTSNEMEEGWEVAMINITLYMCVGIEGSN